MNSFYKNLSWKYIKLFLIINLVSILRKFQPQSAVISKFTIVTIYLVSDKCHLTFRLFHQKKSIVIILGKDMQHSQFMPYGIQQSGL